jgi:hypothetical protein
MFGPPSWFRPILVSDTGNASHNRAARQWQKSEARQNISTKTATAKRMTTKRACTSPDIRMMSGSDKVRAADLSMKSGDKGPDPFTGIGLGHDPGNCAPTRLYCEEQP